MLLDFPTLRGINFIAVWTLGVKAGQMEAKGSYGEGRLIGGGCHGLDYKRAS